MEDYSQLINTLEEIGYELRPTGRNYTTSAVYRGGDNPKAICIYADQGSFFDFVEKRGGSLSFLIYLTLNHDSFETTEEWLRERNVHGFRNGFRITSAEKIHMPAIYPETSMLKLAKNHSYWKKRGINKDVLDLLEGGTVKDGKMGGRYVFPIRDEEGKLVGFAGRYLKELNKDTPKWKLIGEKKYWTYPIQSQQYIQEKNKVILVESIGDMLALFNVGIKYVLVCFGIDVSTGIKKALITLDPDKIIIAFNNDEDGKRNIGKESATKNQLALLRYFDGEQIIIKLPTEKDFGEMKKEDIIEWERELNDGLSQNSGTN